MWRVSGSNLPSGWAASDGAGALHPLCAYACEAGLVIGRKLAGARSNEIPAVPPLLDISFDEDRCRLRKDHSARNFALIRRAALNMLTKNPWKATIKRKRLKTLMNSAFRSQLLAC